jgi:hypothetical protein
MSMRGDAVVDHRPVGSAGEALVGPVPHWLSNPIFHCTSAVTPPPSNTVKRPVGVRRAESLKTEGSVSWLLVAL